MPSHPADLEAWWLSGGRNALNRVVELATLSLNHDDCGFAQVLRSRLIKFDYNQQLHAELEASLPQISAFNGLDYGANPRKNLLAVTQNVFRRNEDGGMNSEYVLEGIGLIDSVERHRLRLLEATTERIGTNPRFKPHRKALDQLHQAADDRYMVVHKGLRGCILLRDIARSAVRGTSPARIMARLNSLFPGPCSAREHGEADLAPYSPGLRDSIRFIVYEFLMCANPLGKQQQEAIQLRILSWCGISSYPEAIAALAHYAEETNKLEFLCLEILHLAELDNSNSHLPSAPPVPDPLLKGMPGREISASKIDGAGFAGDFSAPPILTYPNDLSQQYFHQHPAVLWMEMTSREKASLGLVLPQEIKVRTSYEEDTQSRDEPSRRKRVLKWRGKEKASRVVSDSSIESARASPPGRFRKFVHRIRSQPELQRIAEETPSQLASTPKDLRTPGTPQSRNRSDVLRSRISTPFLRRQSDDSSLRKYTSYGSQSPEPLDRLESIEEMPYPVSVPSQQLDEHRELSQPEQPTYHHETQHESYQGHSQSRHKLQNITIAEPRLAPMEYARIHYLEKALAEKENRPCELPAPTKHLFWTPQYEKFLIVPGIPPGIRRDVVPNLRTRENMPVLTQAPDHGSQTGTTENSHIGPQDPDCPRLSLHLGNSASLYPSVMNLSKLVQYDSAPGPADNRAPFQPVLQHPEPVPEIHEQWFNNTVTVQAQEGIHDSTLNAHNVGERSIALQGAPNQIITDDDLANPEMYEEWYDRTLMPQSAETTLRPVVTPNNESEQTATQHASNISTASTSQSHTEIHEEWFDTTLKPKSRQNSHASTSTRPVDESGATRVAPNIVSTKHVQPSANANASKYHGGKNTMSVQHQARQHLARVIVPGGQSQLSAHVSHYGYEYGEENPFQGRAPPASEDSDGTNLTAIRISPAKPKASAYSVATQHPLVPDEDTSSVYSQESNVTAVHVGTGKKVETSSIHSQESNVTAVHVGSKQKLVYPPRPSHRQPQGIWAKTSSHIEGTKTVQTVIEYSPTSFLDDSETPTPLANFPINSQDSRHTATGFAHQVIGGAGGLLHVQENRQPGFVRRGDVTSLSADVCVATPLSAVPPPLRGSRRPPKLGREESQRYSAVLQGLTEELGEHRGTFEHDQYDEEHHLLATLDVADTAQLPTVVNIDRPFSKLLESPGLPYQKGHYRPLANSNREPQTPGRRTHMAVTLSPQEYQGPAQASFQAGNERSGFTPDSKTAQPKRFTDSPTLPPAVPSREEEVIEPMVLPDVDDLGGRRRHRRIPKVAASSELSKQYQKYVTPAEQASSPEHANLGAWFANGPSATPEALGPQWKNTDSTGSEHVGSLSKSAPPTGSGPRHHDNRLAEQNQAYWRNEVYPIAQQNTTSSSNRAPSAGSESLGSHSKKTPPSARQHHSSQFKDSPSAGSDSIRYSEKTSAGQQVYGSWSKTSYAGQHSYGSSSKVSSTGRHDLGSSSLRTPSAGSESLGSRPNVTPAAPGHLSSSSKGTPPAGSERVVSWPKPMSKPGGTPPPRPKRPSEASIIALNHMISQRGFPTLPTPENGNVWGTTGPIVNNNTNKNRHSTRKYDFQKRPDAGDGLEDYLATAAKTDRIPDQRFDPETRRPHTRQDFVGTCYDFSDPKSTPGTDTDTETTEDKGKGKETEAVTTRQSSSTLGAIFRRANWNGTNSFPKLEWDAFDRTREQPPCTSSWLFGNQEDRLEKELRTKWFEDKAEREAQEAARQRSTSSRERRRRNGSATRQNVSYGAPTSPAPQSPLPPVPSVPSVPVATDSVHSSERCTTQTQQTQRTATPTPAETTAPKEKKARGLKIDTRRLLRAASREMLRGQGSGGGLRAAFRLEGSGWGLTFGPLEEEPEEEKEEEQKSYWNFD